MFIFERQPEAIIAEDRPVSPLNGVWSGTLFHPTALPGVGHVLLLLPLGDSPFTCGAISTAADHYLFYATTKDRPVSLSPTHSRARLLILFLSPGFIHDMAQFLGIDSRVEQLLHGVPLPRGDAVSPLLDEIAGGLEAKKEVERLPGRSPIRLRRMTADG